VYDLVIKGGLVHDGRGGEPFVADVAVAAGRIAEVGAVGAPAREVIDASGLMVTPGFIDIHTHYDGQAIWGDRMAPSSAHGVTTVVTGNCGVGFAPCRKGDRDDLVRLMEGVEDIPGVVLTEGLSWEWETFPEYLDAIDRRPHDIDIATQLPHSALRVYVMGQRAIRREPATEQDNARMAELAREAILAGALGFSTSRNLNHKTRAGESVPSLGAAETELTAIAMGVAAAGRGVLEYSADFAFTGEDVAAEVALYRRIVEASGLPLSVAVAFMNEVPALGRTMLAELDAAHAAGLPIKLQTVGRGVGVLMGLELSLHPFDRCPSYVAIADLPLAERLARLREPQTRGRIIAEAQAPGHQMSLLKRFGDMFPLGDPPNYEPDPDTSVGAQAAAAGRQPEDVLYDLLLAGDGHGLVFMPITNFHEGHLDDTGALLGQDNVLVGLGDGGAHVAVICDASQPTFLLSHWGRDRKRGALPVAMLIKAMTAANAEAVGLRDRGVIAPGYKADLNVIDFERLRLHAPRMVYDLPAGGRRLIQDADGYVATIVSGEVTYRSGAPTGALPGRLVRGGDAADPPAQARIGAAA
jgi:N-acyl-D-aspartate/D-glutamate deacylase